MSGNFGNLVMIETECSLHPAANRRLQQRFEQNTQFRWLLDTDCDGSTLDQSNFNRLHERLVTTDVARRFFDEIVNLRRKQKLPSLDHSTVRGTWVDAWAPLKNFKRTNATRPNDSDDGTGMVVDFKGEKRSHHTHQRTTYPESKLMRKGNALPDKLSYGGHVLMENCNQLCVDILITESTQAELRAARELLPLALRCHIHPKTLGPYEGYNVTVFAGYLREHYVRLHIARTEDPKTLSFDGRTTRTKGYRVSQGTRRRVGEIFGLLKTARGLRRTRFISRAKTQMPPVSGAAYNLLRISKYSVSEVMA
ncbi:MAG: IS5/IS1182 family transposase [Proteobacteria bacterium]|nr:IS5/IS1182 family transposase [Pseudomonadota bacterium]